MSQCGQLSPIRGRHTQVENERGDFGRDAQSHGRCDQRDRVSECARQEQESRLCVRAVHEPSRGCDRTPQTHTQSDSVVRPADRCGLGRTRARGGRGRDGHSQGVVRAKSNVVDERRADKGRVREDQRGHD